MNSNTIQNKGLTPRNPLEYGQWREYLMSLFGEPVTPSMFLLEKISLTTLQRNAALWFQSGRFMLGYFNKGFRRPDFMLIRTDPPTAVVRTFSPEDSRKDYTAIEALADPSGPEYRACSFIPWMRELAPDLFPEKERKISL